jgi:hypothetical protein
VLQYGHVFSNQVQSLQVHTTRLGKCVLGLGLGSRQGCPLIVLDNITEQPVAVEVIISCMPCSGNCNSNTVNRFRNCPVVPFWEASGPEVSDASHACPGDLTNV